MNSPNDTAKTTATRLPRARSRRQRWRCPLGCVGAGIAVLGAMINGAVAQEVVQIEVTTTVPAPSGPAVTVRSTVTTKAATTLTRFTTTMPAIVVSTLTPTPIISWTWTTDSDAQPPLTTREASTAPYCTDHGYGLCPGSLGGGCCPHNYLCALSSCIPPSPVASVETRLCSPQSRLCPETMGFGCCPESMDCAVGSCVPFSISPSTATAISKAGDVPTVVALATGSIDPVKRPAITPVSGEKKKLPNLAIAGIAAGCAVIVIAAGIGAWFTHRRVQKRNGNLPGHTSDSPDTGEGVPTGNAYDPLAPPEAAQRGSGAWRANMSSTNLSSPTHQPWLRGGDLGSSNNEVVDLVSSDRPNSVSGGWMTGGGNANSRITTLSASNSRLSLVSQGREPGALSPLNPNFPSPGMVEASNGGVENGLASPVTMGAGLGKKQWHQSASSLDHGAKIQAQQAVDMATRSSNRSRSGSGGQWSYGNTAHF